MKKIIIYILLLCTISITGLYFSKGESGIKSVKGNNKLLADTVCFSRDILPIFISNCAMSGCHDAASGREGLNLTTYGGIMSGIKPENPSGSKIYRIISSSGNEDAMPPPPRAKLTQAQLDIIQTWILQGATDNPCSSANCDTLNIDYANTIKPILTLNCIGCHSGTNPSGNVNLTNDSIVVQSRSSIAAAVEGLNGSKPMPPGMILDSCYIKQINIWGRVISSPCDTNNVTYAGTIKAILNQNCISCHNGPYSPAGMDFTNDSIVLSAKQKIYGTVAHLPGYHNMPQGGNLDPCNIAQLRIWSNTVTNINDILNTMERTIEVYPNPSNGNMKIVYFLNFYSDVKLEIYNLYGILLTSYYYGMQSPGRHEALIGEAQFSNSGLYFCRIMSDGKIYSAKIMISK